MKLTVSETSKLMGVSVRTLHYYDEIGLLKPAEVSEAGYRFYDEENLAVLQEILFYRELELPLKEIAFLLSQPDHDRKRALHSHRELLLLKQRHIGDLLRLVDETLGGNDTMNKGQFTFADVEEAKNRYAAEARERWGSMEAYRESEEKYKKLTQDEKVGLMDEAGEIYKELAALRHGSPGAPEAQALVRRWQDFITAN
jgi:DNA-binding transcriptional MerR regulator